MHSSCHRAETERGLSRKHIIEGKVQLLFTIINTESLKMTYKILRYIKTYTWHFSAWKYKFIMHWSQLKNKVKSDYGYISICLLAVVMNIISSLSELWWIIWWPFAWVQVNLKPLHIPHQRKYISKKLNCDSL